MPSVTSESLQMTIDGICTERRAAGTSANTVAENLCGGGVEGGERRGEEREREL